MGRGQRAGKYEKGGGGGSGTQKFVYQKWPDQNFPIVNFRFSHDGHFGLGGGGGGPMGGVPPTAILSLSCQRGCFNSVLLAA